MQPLPHSPFDILMSAFVPHLDSQGIGWMVTKALFSLDSMGPFISLPSKSLAARALNHCTPSLRSLSRAFRRP